MDNQTTAIGLPKQPYAPDPYQYESGVDEVNERFFYCSTCTNPKASNVCGRCRSVYYCNKECQKAAWKTHREVCQPKDATTLELQPKTDEKKQIAPISTYKKVTQVQSNFTFPGNFPLSTGFPTYEKIKNDVIQFSSFDSPKTAKDLKKSGYNGIANLKLKNVDNLLAQQNYIEILKHLWTEDNFETRIAWLRPHAEEGHVILMLELSKALFSSMKMKKDYNEADVQEALKWYLLGLFCTRLDASCCNDKSTEAASAVLQLAYHQYMLSQEDSEKYIPDLPQFKRNILEQWELKSTHPSPQWVAKHGIMSFTGKDLSKPADTWFNVRWNTKQDTLKAMKDIN